MADVELDLSELCDRTGVTVRTVRYYVQQGLLPSPGTGPAARYTQEHLDRLRLIRRLQTQHLPLAEIRRRLEGLDGAGVERLLRDTSPSPPTQPQTTTTTTTTAPTSAADYARAILARSSTPAPVVHASSYASTPATPAPAATTAPVKAERSTWERVTLTQDIELHVRRPQARLDNRKVERIIEAALRILNEGEQGGES